MKVSISGMRGEVRQLCAGLVGTVYGFSASTPPAEVKVKVGALVYESTFTFAIPDQVSTHLLYLTLYSSGHSVWAPTAISSLFILPRPSGSGSKEMKAQVNMHLPSTPFPWKPLLSWLHV